jgi:GntR family transcriptional repressor for pyruvate dehydrogenase complex
MKQNKFKIERKRLSGQIIERIIAMITSGELKAGDKLPPEPQLMKQFGVGRSSIREAIGALSLLGLVTVGPGHGTFITDSHNKAQSNSIAISLITIGHGKIRELIEARSEVEQSIVRLASKRATKEDIIELKAQHKKLKDGLKKGLKSGEKLIEADLGFHAALSKICKNSILERFFSELRQPMRNWMEQMASYDWDFEQALEEHQAILKAIETRDPEKARMTMRIHVEIAGKKLSSALLEKNFSKKKIACPND